MKDGVVAFPVGEVVHQSLEGEGKLPLVSVVIPAMNSARTIGDCIGSIKECDYPSFEILVVDGRSSDGTADVARSFGVRVLMGEGRGRAGDINVGVKEARGDIVAITDDDCVVDRRWLKMLSECFADPTVGFAGGPSVTSLDRDTRVGRVGGHVHDFIRLLATRDGEDSVIGCNSAYRRDVLLKLGGFNEEILFGGEDTELNARVLSNGYKAAFQRECIVYHRRRVGLKKLLKQFWLYGKGMGMLYRRDRKALRERSKQVYLALTGMLAFAALLGLSFIYPFFMWALLILVLVYVGSVLGIHFYLFKKTGYWSDPIVFLVVSTSCMFLYLVSFVREQVFPRSIESFRRSYSSERFTAR